jgi:hypothetical protein
MLRITRLAGVCAALLTLACDYGQETDEMLGPEHYALSMVPAIVDARSDGYALFRVDPSGEGYAFFRFMPPTVTGPKTLLPTQNETNVDPVLQICEWVNNACASLVWEFSAKSHSDGRKLKARGHYWVAEWETSLANLNSQKDYRARVLLTGFELGHADIDIVDNSGELASVDRAKYIGIVKGSEVPLTFWIRRGVFTLVRAWGGLIALKNINAFLVFPRGALAIDTYVGVLNDLPAPAGAVIVPGTYHVFLPATIPVLKPLHLVIGYKPNALPPGVAESSLKLLQYHNGAWSEVTGPIVNKGNFIAGTVSRIGIYAVGVLAAAPPTPPAVNVTINTSAPVLGGTISAVQRITNAAPTSCTNNLRDGSLAVANQYWRGPNSIPVVNGECPFQGYVTRVGGYRFEAIVNNVVGNSEPFTVSVPQGTTLNISGVPSGPYYAGATISTGGITVLARDGQGNPLANTDVEVVLAQPAFNFGGSATNSFAQTTNAAGQILLPTGTWTLAATPGLNRMTARLPNTSVSADHDITTTTGAPARLFAPAVTSPVPFGTPLLVTVSVQDASSVTVGVTGTPITATLNTPSGPVAFGTLNAVNGTALFTFNFTQFGPNHTITFGSSALTAHTTNVFEIMGPPPAMPADVRTSAITSNSMNVEVQNVAFNGSTPRFQVRYMPSPGGSFTSVDVPAVAGAYVTHALTGLAAGTQYEVGARACDSYGCSPWTASLSIPTLQPAPQNLRTTSVATTSANIAWDAQTIANGAVHDFQVWLAQGTGPLARSTTTTSPVASFTGLLPNTQYTAEVRACNASGCSASQVNFTTQPLPTPPAAPNRLQINSQLPTAIGLAWSDNSINEDGFHVLKQTLPGTAYIRIGTVGAGVNTYSDTDVIQGQTVLYQVQAFNAGGTTSSNIISTVVPAGQTVPMAPYNTMLTQTGTAGAAATYTPRVRVVNTANGAALFGVPVTFTITGGGGNFGPGVTVVTVNTNASGLAAPPTWVLGSGTNTATATGTGLGTVTFTAQGN